MCVSYPSIKNPADFLQKNVPAKPETTFCFDSLYLCMADWGEKRALYASYRSELLTINGGDVSISNRPQSPGTVGSYDCWTRNEMFKFL